MFEYLHNKTVRDLKQICKAEHIHHYSKMKKDELCAALSKKYSQDMIEKGLHQLSILVNPKK